MDEELLKVISVMLQAHELLAPEGLSTRGAAARSLLREELQRRGFLPAALTEKESFDARLP